MRDKNKGFTLIELMIVVAIVAILAAIAVPSYIDYVRRGAIPEGLAALSDEKVKMEQYFMDNRGYAGKCTGADAPYPVQVGKFAITCALPGASAIGYTLTATGSGTVDQFIYTIDNRDTKTTASTGVWGKSSTATPSCWILKKDGSC